jgi:SAM-dependent methyltransferase
MTMPSPNAAQIAYWNGPMGKIWAAAREKRDRDHAGLTQAGLALAAPRPGETVLDIGCGSGTTTLLLAEAVAPGGQVTGIDLSGPMLALARDRARQTGSSARFVEADASVHGFARGAADLVFSQLGVMFFADPTLAFANIARAMKPSGRLVFVCWRGPAENPWSAVPEGAAKPFLPPAAPAAVNAPGRYGLADGQRIRAVLTEAGFSSPEIERLDVAVHLGDTPELAASSSIDAGPLLRTLADADDATRARVRAAVTERLAKEMGRGGITLTAGAWLVRATR